MLKITVEDETTMYRRVEATGFEGFHAVYLIQIEKPARDIESDIYVQYHEYLDLKKSKRQMGPVGPTPLKGHGAGDPGAMSLHSKGCVQFGATLGEIPKGRHTGESPEARKNYFENRDFD